MDFNQAQYNMIECQLRPNRVTSSSVLKAFSTIPRQQFVGQEIASLAYMDEELSLGNDRYLMSPQVTARLLQALCIEQHNLVLQVACGSGYEVALTAQLADMVIGLENCENLMTAANINLAALNIGNAEITSGELSQGVPNEAPFDAILICGGVEQLPESLPQQLCDQGRLAYVQINNDAHMGEARLITRHGNTFTTAYLFDAYTHRLKEFTKTKTFVL